MCRNIKQLRQPDHPPTNQEIELAALQYVRKVSGYRQPSKANTPAFNQAVVRIAAATQELLGSLAPKPGA